MRASVVVAAYDEARWIGASLTTLLGQLGPEDELVVVDDGSRDGTGAIAAAAGARVLRTAHRGAGAARDAGLRATSGEIVVFLDADELYAPGFLEALVAPIAAGAAERTFPGGLRWANAAEGLAPGWLRVRGALRADGRAPAYGAEHPFPKALRRAALERAGGYPRTGFGEDAELGALVGPAVVVPEAEFAFTLPTGAREVLRKARWIGRGPRFAREGPALWRLSPPVSAWRAAALLRAGEPRAAAVRLLYDAGLLAGRLDRRLRPSRADAA